ncbi:MAG: N-acetylmuramoyl-L-alanine amidase [Rubrobacteraceae bacterium]|nr:N-acetylmuramoyl-L-alanine amidase [Rubrobacteraceae bacterium]
MSEEHPGFCLGSGRTKAEENEICAASMGIQRAESGSVSKALVPPDYYADRFVPASPANYTPGRQGVKVDTIVIHVMESSQTSAISWFQNPGAQVSAHYCLDPADACQMVSESDTAWHAGNWTYNLRSVGIEHRGYYNDPNNWSEALLERSAKIAAGIIHRHGIPVDRKHIIGHGEVPGSPHPNCPGPYFPWSHYLDLVRQYAHAVPAPHTRLYRVQAGAFSHEKNAEALAARLKKSGFDAFVMYDGSLYRVQCGAFTDKENAERLAARLKKAGYQVLIKGG